MNKPTLVLAVVAILGASFFAGQQSFGTTYEYEHADVIDAVEACSEGQFIGGCKPCGDCAADEYKAGGCSYFKNTFCALCPDIRHCPHENIRCEPGGPGTEVCTECDFGYWDWDCKPCTNCYEYTDRDGNLLTTGMYEIVPCQQTADAVCAPCTVCTDTEYLTQECRPTEDSTCAPCSSCELDTYMSIKCQTWQLRGLTELESVLKENLGTDTQCAACSKCGPRHPTFVDTMLYATRQCETCYQCETECDECDECEDDEFILELCEPGTTQELGQNTICQDCTKRKENEWTVFPCDPHHTSDAVFQECSECVPGEYLFADCTIDSDTVCPRCPDATEKLYSGSVDFKSGLQYCKKDPDTELYLVRCHSDTNDDGVVEPDASTCGYWSDDIDDEGEVKKRCTHEFMGGGNCGVWHSDCEEDFSGESCCYHKYPYNCGTITSREREGRRAGYTGESTEDFIHFCQVLCDEFPDCMAFEVEDGGVAGAPYGGNLMDRESKCYFKAAYTQDPYHNWYGGVAHFDCYSNTCRQNTYEIIGSKFVKTINYDVTKEYAGKKTTKDVDEKDELSYEEYLRVVAEEGYGEEGGDYSGRLGRDVGSTETGYEGVCRLSGTACADDSYCADDDECLGAGADAVAAGVGAGRR